MCDCHTPKQDFIVMTCDSKLLHHVISMKLNIGKKMTELEIMTLNYKKNLACFQTYSTGV